MSDPLFQNVSVVRHVDDDTFEVVGAAPGPAGAATVELPDGGVLSIDYAEPGLLVEYEFDGAAAATDTSLTTIVGDRVMDRVRRYVDAPADRPLRIASTTTRRFQEPRGSLDPDREARRVGDVVVAADRASDPDRSIAERALAALDVADQADPFTLPALDKVGRVHARIAADLVEEAADDLTALAALEPVLYDAIVLACRSLPDLDAVERTTAALAEPVVDHGWWEEPAPDAAVAGEAPDVAALEARVPAAAAPSAPARLHIEQVGGVWIVRPGPGADGRWVRVLRRDDLGVVGVAPVLDHAGEPTAEVVVPSHLELDDVTITVTTEPFPAGPTDGLAAFAEAVRSGRHATDLEALGHADRARREWQRCAALWDALGDDDRARTARRYAQDRDRLERRRPTLADRLVDARS